MARRKAPEGWRTPGRSRAIHGVLERDRVVDCGGPPPLCEFPLATLTRRFPARTVIATGYAVPGLGVGLIASAHTMSVLVLCMVILTLGEMVAMPVCSAYVADLAPPQKQGL